MENARNYLHCFYATNEFAFLRRVSRVNYHSSVILNEHTAIVQTHPMQVVLDKPVYVGTTILDLSKLLMTTFFYRGLRPTFHQPPESKLTVYLTDTDSFIFSVRYRTNSSRDYYRDLGTIIEYLDLASYPLDHPLYASNADVPNFATLVKKNKGVLGKMKDELGGDTFMTQLCCLKPKMYSFKMSNNAEHKVCKGIASNVRNNVLSFASFKEVYETTNPVRHSVKNIRSRAHRLYIESMNKTSLSLFEDKRSVGRRRTRR